MLMIQKLGGVCRSKTLTLFLTQTAISIPLGRTYLYKVVPPSWRRLGQENQMTIESNVIVSRGGTPYNGLYGEAAPKRGTFYRLQVYKRVGISQV